MPEFRDTVTGIGPLGNVDTGSSQVSELEFAGDRDVFLTHLIGNLTYQLEQRGDTSDATLSLHDPFLRLYSAFDPVIPIDDGILADDAGLGFRDSLIAFTPGATGNFFLQAGGFNDTDVGTYRVLVSAGQDTLGLNFFNGTSFNDAINGLGGNDTLNGLGGNDVLDGNTDNDTLFGGNGNDTLFGGEGSDILHGEAGNDVLLGGLQTDTLIGGVGSDTFTFRASASNPAARDNIIAGDGATAFQGAGAAGGDRIDVSLIDANATSGGNQTFIWGGNGKGHISAINVGTDTIIHANTDNDAAFEFEVRIADGGITANQYNAGDFVL